MESSRYVSKLQEAHDIAKTRAIIRGLQLGGNAIIGVRCIYIQKNN